MFRRWKQTSSAHVFKQSKNETIPKSLFSLLFPNEIREYALSISLFAVDVERIKRDLASFFKKSYFRDAESNSAHFAEFFQIKFTRSSRKKNKQFDTKFIQIKIKSSMKFKYFPHPLKFLHNYSEFDKGRMGYNNFAQLQPL